MDRRHHRYRVLDVFTQQALEGNPLAVFPEGSQIDSEQMQKIARELNLSETVFVLPPERHNCVARFRIFTPARELMFAGHPTIGAAFVLTEEGAIPKSQDEFFVEEGVGSVAVRIERAERRLIWLRTPAIAFGRHCNRSVCAEALGLSERDLLPMEPQIVSAGNPVVFVPVRDKDAVDRAEPELQGLRKVLPEGGEPLCLFVFTPTSEGAYSRMFAPELGIVEDPATGSATGPLAAYMMRNGLLQEDSEVRFISEQGTKMGRRSLLHVHIFKDAGTAVIEVGGHVIPVIDATMTLQMAT